MTAVFICSSLLFAVNIQHAQQEAQLTQTDRVTAASVSFGRNNWKEILCMEPSGLSPTTVT